MSYNNNNGVPQYERQQWVTCDVSVQAKVGMKFEFLVLVSPFHKKMVGLRRNGHAKRNKMSYFSGEMSKCGPS